MKLVLNLTGLAGIGMVVSSVHATVLVSPTVIGGSNAYGQTAHNLGGYTSANSVNGNVNEYASANAGVDTFLNFQWASAQTFDRVILVNRNSGFGGDLISNATLTYDSGSDTFNTDSGQARSLIYSVGSTITQNVRFDVNTLAVGTTGNTGLMEAIFLNTPTATYNDAFVIGGVSAYNSATAYNGDYAATNAVDGYVGHAGQSDYASQNSGLNTFVDFNLGAVTKIIGFDMIDRWFDEDQTRGFNLIYSNTSDFSSILTTQSYSKGANTVAYGADFNYIEAQYVRFDVTNMDGAAGAAKGLTEMIFYGTSVPEPSAALLGGLGLLALLRRRRN
jgi:MYXO-CTERM domain-containing protein